MLLGKVVICLQKIRLDPCLSPCTSINSKWINDLNIRPETLKLEAQQLRKRIDKWDYLKLKIFCTTKKMVSKLKRLPTQWEKTFARYTSDKGLITRIYGKVKD
jgi:hypothetical protein